MMLKIGEYLKGQFEKNLPGLTVPTKMQPFAQKLKLEASGDYAMSYAGWSPDYMDQCHSLKCIRQVMRKTKYITQTQRMMI